MLQGIPTKCGVQGSEIDPSTPWPLQNEPPLHPAFILLSVKLSLMADQEISRSPIPDSSPAPDSSGDIAPDGDVLFLVGPDEKRLRVHSFFLRNASPVFKAMLGLDFREGNQLAQSGVVEIPLPDDDVAAMEIVLNVIHGRNDAVPKTLGTAEFLQVAIVGDKYDCLGHLSFAVIVWLCRLNPTDPKMLWELTATTLLLRDANAFKLITAAFIMRNAGSYLQHQPVEGIVDRVSLLRAAGEPISFPPFANPLISRQHG